MTDWAITYDSGFQSQLDRGMLVSAFLDINLGTWKEYVAGLTDADADELQAMALDQIIADAVTCLESVEEGFGTIGQMYIQNIGLLSDISLHYLVNEVSGSCPLHQ